MFSLFFLSLSQFVESSPDAAISQCSQWEPRGVIKGRPSIPSGVWCQVGPKAAEGNAWFECVDGTTKPEGAALTYTGICPPALSDAGARLLQDGPAALISRCSKWESRGVVEGRPNMSSGVWCQSGNALYECADGTTKPTAPALAVTGLCVNRDPINSRELFQPVFPGEPMADINFGAAFLTPSNLALHFALEQKNRAVDSVNRAGKERSLQDTPDAAISQCTSWKSRGLIQGSPAVPIGGVWCQVGPKAPEGNVWFECVDSNTKPTGSSLLYTGICPPSVEEVGDIHV